MTAEAPQLQPENSKRPPVPKALPTKKSRLQVLDLHRRPNREYFSALAWPDGMVRLTIRAPRAKYLGQFDLTAAETEELRDFLTLQLEGWAEK